MKRMIGGNFSLSGTQWTLLVGVLPLVFQPVLVGDLFGYLVYGDWMLEHNVVTRADHFSFTAEGSGWINHEWLFQLVLGGVFEGLGWIGLLGVQLLFVGTILLAVAGLANRTEANTAGWLLGLGVPLLSLVPGLTLRPQLLTYLAILVLVVWLRTDRPLRWYDGVALAGLFAVWSNIHGGMVVGLAFLGFLLGSRFLLKPTVCRVASGFLVFATCLGATLLNPYGYELWAMILRTVNDPITSVFIEEWRPTWEYPFHMTVWCLLGVQWVSGVVLNSDRDRRVLLLRLLGLLGVAVLSLWPRRNLTYYGLAVVAFAPPIAPDWPADWTMSDQVRRGLLTGVTIGGILLLAGTLKTGFYPGDRVYPSALVDRIDTTNGDRNVFVYYPWAQWAVFENPSIRVFLDGRWKTVYSDEIIRDYGKILLGDTRVLSRYNVDWILLPPDYALNHRLRNIEHWLRVGQTQRAVLWRQSKGVTHQNE